MPVTPEHGCTERGEPGLRTALGLEPEEGRNRVEEGPLAGYGRRLCKGSCSWAPGIEKGP